MSKFLASLGGNAGAIGAGALTVAVLATGVWIGNTREAAEIVQPAALAQPAPEAEPAPKVESAIAEDVTPDAPKGVADAPETAADVAAPAFDEVRRENDGMTVVAGRAAPGAQVQLLRDGEVIATTTADGSGKFATLAVIAPDGRGHVLSLSQRVNDAEIASVEEIILAPTEAPVVVAEVTPDLPLEVAEIEVEEPEPPVEVTDVPVATPEVTAEAVVAVQDKVEPAIADAPTPQAIENVATQTTQTAEVAPTPTTAPAPKDVAVLKSTAEGVELLNPAAPEVMDGVALDTIGYSNEGDVRLAGRAQPDTQSVRVYLDNNSVVNLPVDDQGRWRGDVPDVDEGIYTLRVDEVGADGTVTSRIETPFKRESAVVLTQAAADQEGPIKAITVQAGATLWAIARERYGDGQLYLRVFEANASDIRDPDLIYPGQVFDLPD